MDDLNFKQGIKKILPQNFAISRHGVDLLNKLLKSQSSVLVNFCLERNINMTTVHQAVESSFTGSLTQPALAEGNRVLIMHANGLLKYEPQHPETQIRKRKKGKKEKIIEAQEFSEGISDLTSLTFNDQVSLQDESKKIMCELLEDLAVKISDLVQSRTKDNITQKDITNEVEHLLPGELARHAIGEGARMLFLHQHGVLEARSKSVAKTEMPRKARKRRGSPLAETTVVAKRKKRSTSTKKSSKKAPKRTSRSKKRTRKSPKASSKRSRRKRSVSKDGTSATKLKRARKSSSRKRASGDKAPKSTKAAKSKKSVSSSRRKKSKTRKSPRRVSPKTVRKISEKQPTKKKTVSKKETTQKVSSVVKTEIKSGMKKLNKSYKQELSTAGEELISQYLYKLLNSLSEKMRKDKISSIGPMEVRRAVIKVFPKELADSAIAELSRVLMTT